MSSSSNSNLPVYGNYHSYYSKRPFVLDSRLGALPKGIFHGATVLDVGCNEGWVTCEIAQSHGASKVIGVDIDGSLISAAWKRRRVVWSRQGPGLSKAYSAKRKRDPGSDLANGSAPIPEYFPESLALTFGHLPIPPSTRETQDKFPHNLSFRTADWASQKIPEDDTGYDVVIAFSLTKWIHIHNGDEGLKKFFERVHAVLNPGGFFVLEPQSWESYAKTKRMDPTVNNLKLRPEDFQTVLEGIGFVLDHSTGPVGEGG
ncbi:Bin3-domain-containing protein [Thelephora ganbajun]|uniref:Bin3-domain-containing protein n=1 Tax=Thelephora ganbajun TaxID=370292 RepID=A0ACB6ZID4_THEGA|nr:Bin3-domain-containing protein [Thelephora ganbajun]